jgi:magnesium chelatase family protein
MPVTSKVLSATTCGIDAYLVEVEVDIASGLPQTTIVGLPDQTVKESKERVKSAIKNSGFPFSSTKLTINLAPADLKKEGPSFDLPIAIGILACNGYINPSGLEKTILLGELALDGVLRKAKGVLSVASLSGRTGHRLIIPKANEWEASMEKRSDIRCAATLRDVASFLNGESTLPEPRSKPTATSEDEVVYDMDFSEVKGQWLAKRAIEIAAAGAHNLLFIGPPGAGKTMLSRRIPTILPPLRHEEIIEISKIYSVAGQMPHTSSLLNRRPFRAPHHTISQIGLVGGGSFPRPGEISLAHGGVLFLDEFPEFRRDAIEALRGPLEDGEVLISRAKQSIRFPSRFLFVCAMNPCPCGHLMSKKQTCRCSLGQIQRYVNKISGPIFDRMDLHVELPAIEYSDLVSAHPSESSCDVKTRVLEARARQADRFQDSPIRVNSEMNPRELKRHCSLGEDGGRLLEQAMKELGFSARGYHKVLKVARTIADLDGSEKIGGEHVAEALQYRTLDRSYVH